MGRVSVYEAEVEAAGAGDLLTAYPVPLASPFGHCVFTLQEVQGALTLLLTRVGQSTAGGPTS